MAGCQLASRLTGVPEFFAMFEDVGEDSVGDAAAKSRGGAAAAAGGGTCGWPAYHGAVARARCPGWQQRGR